MKERENSRDSISGTGYKNWWRDNSFQEKSASLFGEKCIQIFIINETKVQVRP
jgi:hypothetical protein